MNKNFLLILSIFFIITTICVADPEIGSNKIELIKQWETKPELKIPESVVHDTKNDVLYVSNINGNPAEKNGKGFISKVSLSGKIEILEWINGLNAPKGLAIFEGKLYVADIDKLVEISVENGKILKEYKVKGAKFLNDVAVDISGTVYISDSSSENSIIYKFSNGEFIIWVKNEEIKRPNGLYVDKNKLIVGNTGDGRLKEINFINKNIKTVAIMNSGIDGITKDENGNFIISDWSGKISLIETSGKYFELLDTTRSKINAADLTYCKSKHLLFVPTFFDNRVMAYGIVKK